MTDINLFTESTKQIYKTSVKTQKYEHRNDNQRNEKVNRTKLH